MSISLELNEYKPNAAADEPLTGEKARAANTVKTLGGVALVLAIAGIFIPFVADIAGLFLAKHALKIARNNVVPIEYETAATWASRLSIVGLVWWCLVLLRILI